MRNFHRCTNTAPQLNGNFIPIVLKQKLLRKPNIKCVFWQVGLGGVRLSALIWHCSRVKLTLPYGIRAILEGTGWWSCDCLQKKGYYLALWWHDQCLSKVELGPPYIAGRFHHLASAAYLGLVKENKLGASAKNDQTGDDIIPCTHKTAKKPILKK